MSDNKSTAQSLLDLQDFLYDFLVIDRKIFLPERVKVDRAENNVEHTFNLTMIAWFLSSKFADLDTNKVIRYSLVHDLVEVHAGDVMAIGRSESEQEEKEAREHKAMNKIIKAWSPSFSEMTTSLESYEKQIDQGAIFVKALDKLLPLLHNIHGGGYTWKKWDMKIEDIIKHKDEKTVHSKEVYEVWQELKKLVLEHPEWFNEGKAD